MKHSSSKNKQLFALCKKLKYTQRCVFSDRPLSSIDSYSQIKSYKPFGLWYSYGPAWIEFISDDYKDKDSPFWCSKRLFNTTHVYTLKLDYKKIYKIHDDRQFTRFVKNYAKGNKVFWNLMEKRGWHGIEIRYQDKYNKYAWYDGWDCSSGCIWDNKAVKKVILLKAWKAHWKSSSSPVSF